MTCRENTYILHQIIMPFLRLWMVPIQYDVYWGRRRYGQTRAVSRQNLLRLFTSRRSRLNQLPVLITYVSLDTFMGGPVEERGRGSILVAWNYVASSWQFDERTKENRPSSSFSNGKHLMRCLS